MDAEKMDDMFEAFKAFWHELFPTRKFFYDLDDMGGINPSIETEIVLGKQLILATKFGNEFLEMDLMLDDEVVGNGVSYNIDTPDDMFIQMFSLFVKVMPSHPAFNNLFLLCTQNDTFVTNSRTVTFSYSTQKQRYEAASVCTDVSKIARDANSYRGLHSKAAAYRVAGIVRPEWKVHPDGLFNECDAVKLIDAFSEPKEW